MCAHPSARFKLAHACGVCAAPCADTHTHTHTDTGIFFKHTANLSVLVSVCARARAHPFSRVFPLSNMGQEIHSTCKREEMRGRECASRIRERKRMRATLMCECVHVPGHDLSRLHLLSHILEGNCTGERARAYIHRCRCTHMTRIDTRVETEELTRVETEELTRTDRRVETQCTDTVLCLSLVSLLLCQRRVVTFLHCVL